MDRRDFLLSSTLAAAAAASVTSNGPVLAQTATEPGVNPPPRTLPMKAAS